ncbi:unnamed protein product [Boreogadus saida]
MIQNRRRVDRYRLLALTSRGAAVLDILAVRSTQCNPFGSPHPLTPQPVTDWTVWHSGRCQRGRGLSWAVWAGQSRGGMLVGFERPLRRNAAPHYLLAHYQASVKASN